MIDIIKNISSDLSINISCLDKNKLVILEKNKVINYIINFELNINSYNSTILCNNKILLKSLLENNNINNIKTKEKKRINNFRIIMLNKNIEIILKEENKNYLLIDLSSKDLNEIKKLALKSFQIINGLILGFIDIIENENNELIVLDIVPNIIINKFYEINQEKFYLFFTKVIKFMFNIEDNEWYVYLIKNNNCTYVGATNNTERRIKKHNGELSGGAKYTASKGSGWKYICIISGFDTKINALRFEWAFKHEKPKKAGGIKNRIKKLISVVSKEKWTEKSPLAKSLPLNIKWHDTLYKPDNSLFPNYIKSN